MTLDDIKESALMALDTLRANKLRSALTILGVSVGVLTVIFMVSIIQGLNKAFADQIESLGSNTIFISKFEPSFGRPPGPEEIHRKDLTMDDAEALRTEAQSIVGVSPIHRMLARIAPRDQPVVHQDQALGIGTERVAHFAREAEAGAAVGDGHD